MFIPILTHCVRNLLRANLILICDAKSNFWQLLTKP